MRTDERFRAAARAARGRRGGASASRGTRGCRQVTRGDVPIQVVAQFLGMLANGVAFARVTDDAMPDLDQLMTLIETGVAPR